MEVCWLRDGVVGSWNFQRKLICDFLFYSEHRAGYREYKRDLE